MSERGNNFEFGEQNYRFQKPGYDEPEPRRPRRAWCAVCRATTVHRSPLGCVVCNATRMKRRMEARNEYETTRNR